MGFKVKLVSPDKIRRNQMAQDVSRGIGSFLGSTGDAMALSAQRQAAEQAGAQLNQQLGLNIPSSVYGQTNPGALLGMMANAQMAAKAQAENLNRLRLSEEIQGRAVVEAEKFKLRAKQMEPKINVPQQFQQMYGGAGQVPASAVPADIQKQWMGLGGQGQDVMVPIPEKYRQAFGGATQLPMKSIPADMLNEFAGIGGGASADPVEAELKALTAERLALLAGIQDPIDLSGYRIDRKARGPIVDQKLQRLDQIANRMQEISSGRRVGVAPWPQRASQDPAAMPGDYPAPAGPDSSLAPGGTKTPVDQAWIQKNIAEIKGLSQDEIKSLVDDLEAQGFDTADLQDMLLDGQ